MNNKQLYLRMAVVGSILLGFYLLAAVVVSGLTGFPLLPILLVGIVLLPAFQYKLGKWLATRGAEEMPETGQYQEIHHMTETLCQRMDLPKPKLMVMEMGTPNAFATGRKGAGVVVVSTELLAILERDELEGVIAHELAHIKNRDVITMVIGQSIGTIVGYAAYFIVTALGERSMASIILGMVASMLANFLVMLFVLAISRYREYVADADAKAAIGGNGDPLARALEKIALGSEGRESTVDDSVAALCIFNSSGGLLQSLLRTHPPAEKRIQKLRS
ncbi:M48 family metallopeptidase [Natronobiforma cellulositropha]|uniref:M48 family metallopeptidase n=1 Tax=Natronobiforma cellulositropha TaxID=1679076 RepID=UPI0021D61175|nr:M48 family metalloprotease [Natronobiforma cellulositropha]